MSFESNAFTIKTEYNISPDVIFSILSIYGQIENFKTESNFNITEINISYFDIRSAKKAFNEISFNFEKLLNYQTDKYSLSYVKNKKEFYEKFLLVIVNLTQIIKFTSLDDVEKIIKFMDYHCEIDKIYKNESEMMIRFFNLKDKIRLLFFLSKMINSTNEFPSDKITRTEVY